MHSELFFFSPWFWWVCQVNRGHKLYCMYTFFHHQVKILSGVVENLSVSGCLWSGHFNIMLHLLSLFIITNFLAEGEPIMKNYLPNFFFPNLFLCWNFFSVHILYIQTYCFLSLESNCLSREAQCWCHSGVFRSTVLFYLLGYNQNSSQVCWYLDIMLQNSVHS